MKRILYLIALFMLLFVLSGCAGGENEPPSGGEPNTINNELDSAAGLRYFLKDDNTYAVAIEPNENTVNIVIPSERKNLPVNEIVYSSLFEKEHRTVPISVTIPESITKIGEYSFSEYSSLKNVTVPKSVTEIGRRAFYGCISINELDLVTEGLRIGDEAFGNCIGIDKLTLGNSIGTVSESSLHGAAIKNAALPARFLNILPSAHIVSLDITHGDIIPDETLIGALKLTSVTICDSVTHIGNSAFYGCEALTELKLGSGLLTIGAKAFAFCGISSLSVPNNVSHIGEGAFAECAISTLSAPASIISVFRSDNVRNVTVTSGDALSKSAFFGFSRLENVVLSDSIKTIGDYAFSNCSSLQNISIGPAISHVGKNVFNNSAPIKTTLFNGAYYIGNESSPYTLLLKAESKNITECEIHPNAKIIYEYAFQNCAGLREITVPYGICNIGQYAMSGCTSLSSLSLPQDIGYIGYRAFDRCDALSLNEYGGATYLGDDNSPYTVLIGVSDMAVQSIEIHPDTQHIYTNAFYFCARLTEIVLPNSIISIGGYAFYGCYALSSVTLSDSLQHIGEYAFCGLSSLDSISFPKTLKSIGIQAFADCEALENAEFAICEGWFCDDEVISADLLSNTELAADYLISTHVSDSWKRN